MPIGNALSWMLGLVKCRQGQMALDFYQQLQQEGVEPTTVNFVGVLSACASVAALDEGVHVPKWI
jgi:pentatricopeptide repeat protein